MYYMMSCVPFAALLVTWICCVIQIVSSPAQFEIVLGISIFFLFAERGTERRWRSPIPSQIICQLTCWVMQEEWTCDHCKKNYHKPSIEATLVEILQKKSLCFQLQDLVCEKCKQVKPNNMADICGNCSGKFVNKTSEAEFKKRYSIVLLYF
jgi:hypothetical protein